MYASIYPANVYWKWLLARVKISSSLGAGLPGNCKEEVKPGTVLRRALITCSVGWHANRIEVTTKMVPSPQVPSHGSPVVVCSEVTVCVSRWPEKPGDWRNALWHRLGVRCYVITTLYLTYSLVFFPILQAGCVHHHAEPSPPNTNPQGLHWGHRQ